MKKLIAELRKENSIKYVLSNDDEPYAFGEFDIDECCTGDIYCGAVRERHQNSNAYFCNIGEKRTGYFPSSKCKTGDFLLLQVKNAPHGTKGATLSEMIYFNGRYTVCEFVPVRKSADNSPKTIIKLSKKLPQDSFFDWLRVEINMLADSFADAYNGYCLNIIVRTEAGDFLNNGNDDISPILDEVTDNIKKFSECLVLFDNTSENKAVGKIYSCGFLSYINGIYRVASFDEICVSDPPLVSLIMNEPARLRAGLNVLPVSKNGYSLFELNNAARKLPSLLGRTVTLKSGAELVIEKTEAMTVIDVNASSSKLSHFEVNREAAVEIMRQLQLRNIGGIIMCDFINTDEEKSLELLELLNVLSKEDYTLCEVCGLTKLGIVEISRKRS